MTDEPIFPEDQSDPAARVAGRRRFPWAMMVVAGLFVVVTFMSWYGSWFGRPLSDAQIEKYLSDQEKPRSVQQALSHIGNRIIDGDGSVKRWYPLVISKAEHPVAEVRQTAAWVMGQDNTYDDFHRQLLAMLGDTHPGVRHNAAVQLVRFNDAAGRRELTAMLESQKMVAERSGSVEFIIKEEEIAVAANAPLFRIKQGDGLSTEARTQQAARVEMLAVSDGESVEAGQEVMRLAPSTEQAWEALRALYIIGQPEDIPYVERYTSQVSGMPDRVRQQAIATVRAIKARGQSAASR